MGGWSEEEYLLGSAKHSSNVHPDNQGNLPRSSSDRDVYHKCTRGMGTQKYLRKNCYHCIEYSATNSLVAFI